MDPQFDTYHITLILVALITGVISPIVLQLTKFFLVKSTGKSNVKNKNSSLDEERIIKKLENILGKYNADRAWIAEFHNGDTNYSGKSFQKFSETYEEVKRGVSTEALTTQAIPTSVFVRFFTQLNNEGYYFLKDINQINKTDLIAPSIESFLVSRGIISYFAVAIKDIKGNFVGILCLDGVNNELNIGPKEIQELIYTAANLAGYLEVVDAGK